MVKTTGCTSTANAGGGAGSAPTAARGRARRGAHRPGPRGAQGCGGGAAGCAGTQGRGCLGSRDAFGMVIRGPSACFEKSAGHFTSECVRPRAAGCAFEPAACAKCLVARPLQSGTFGMVPKAAYTRWRFDQHFFRFTHSRSKRPSPVAGRSRSPPALRHLCSPVLCPRPPSVCPRSPPARARPPPTSARPAPSLFFLLSRAGIAQRDITWVI